MIWKTQAFGAYIILTTYMFYTEGIEEAES